MGNTEISQGIFSEEGISEGLSDRKEDSEEDSEEQKPQMYISDEEYVAKEGNTFWTENPNKEEEEVEGERKNKIGQSENTNPPTLCSMKSPNSRRMIEITLQVEDRRLITTRQLDSRWIQIADIFRISCFENVLQVKVSERSTYELLQGQKKEIVFQFYSLEDFQKVTKELVQSYGRKKVVFEEFYVDSVNDLILLSKFQKVEIEESLVLVLEDINIHKTDQISFRNTKLSNLPKTQLLFDVLRWNNHLKKLILSRIDTSDEIIEIFCKSYKHNNTISTLECHGTPERVASITQIGAEFLANWMIESNKSLQNLSLQFTTLGDEGANVLLESSINAPNLRILDLSNNKLGDHIHASVFRVLESSKRLERLVLRDNLLQETFFRAIEKSNHFPNGPVRLKLSGNACCYLVDEVEYGEDLEDLIVPFDDLKLCSKVGSGGPEIQKGSWNGYPVTIKKFGLNLHILEAGTREIKKLSKLRHPSVIQCFGVSATRQYAYVVMEFVEMNLKQFLYESGVEKKAEGKMKMIVEIVSGLVYLQKKKIFDLQLHSSNILLGLNGGIKISGFRCFNSKIKKKIPSLTDFRGERIEDLESYYDFSPEVEQYGEVREKTDVFAFGMLMFEILYQKVPFKYPSEAYEKISKNELGSVFTEKVFQEEEEEEVMRAIIRKCWKKEEKERPSFQEIQRDLKTHFGKLFLPS